jgi:trehalose 6-phosphate phosphatase
MDISHVPLLSRDTALFLNMEYALVGRANECEKQLIDSPLRHSIKQWRDSLDGALALVSSRTLDEIDRAFAPVQLSVAGQHGLERRAASGRIHREPANTPAIRASLERLRLALAREPTIIFEDRGSSLAIYWRTPAGRPGVVRDAANVELARLGSDYRLLLAEQEAHLVLAKATSGTAVRAFMAERPFQGRRPVFVGDEVSDFEGFEAAKEFGGYGIAVGANGLAEYRLNDVRAVRRWLGAVQ